MFNNWKNEQIIIHCFITMINRYTDMKHGNNLESSPLYGSTLDTEQQQGSKMFTRDFFPVMCCYAQ